MLSLDLNVILQVMGDRDFYAESPAYFFLRDQALATISQFHSSLRGESKPPCRNCNDKAALRPLVSAFTAHTVQLYNEDPTLLRPLRDYITKRRRLRDREMIRLYYRHLGATKHLDF